MKGVKKEIKGKKEIHDICVSLLMNSGLRKAEIRSQITQEKLSSNSFRHAYATNYFRNMNEIRSTLGHTSINMTSKYIKYSKIRSSLR